MTTPRSNGVSFSLITLSSDAIINSLLGGSEWGLGLGATVDLTYSFPVVPSYWLDVGYSSENEPFATGIIPLSAARQSGARLALSTWTDYANVRISEVPDNQSVVGDIRIAYTPFPASLGQQAHSYLPSDLPAAGDIWLNSLAPRAGDLSQGSFEFTTLLHEIGHALGLKHPFDPSPASVNGVGLNDTILPVQLDDIKNTIMSYDYYPGYSIGSYIISYSPTTPMEIDIRAVQHLYGPNTDYNAGNDTYTFHQGQDYFQTIYDAGGNDTIVWDATDQGGAIDLDPGSWSALGNSLTLKDVLGTVVKTDPDTVAIYSQTTIENATGGGGNDTLTGNDANNLLQGMDGHDNLYGGAGADTLMGGDGNDHLYGQSAAGGPDGADSLSGGNGSDYLQGNAGNDTLDGGDGSDRINGGANDDLITGGVGNDTVNGNLGNDTIDGGDGNDSLRGGQGNDSIAGGDGDDVISGDLGQDMVSGGTGADLFQFTGQASPESAPDRIADFTHGADLLSIGFRPVIVLNGAAQANLAAAGTLAQQLFDGDPGDHEAAAIGVGADSYIFYASDAGGTVNSAILLAGVAAGTIATTDFI